MFFDIHSHGSLQDNTLVSQTCLEYQETFLNRTDPLPLDMQESKRFINSYLSVGIHPWQNFSIEKSKHCLAQIEKLAQQKEIVAVGEAGIDRITSKHSPKHSIKTQKKIFEQQIQIAEQYSLPLIIHSVHAHSDIFSLRKIYKKNPWMIHGFIGNLQEMRQCLAHEIRISPGFAFLEHQKNLVQEHSLYKNLAQIPPDFIFLETDATSIDITKIYHYASQALNLSLPKLQEQIQKNLLRDFSIELRE